MTKTADEWTKTFDTMNLRQAAEALQNDIGDAFSGELTEAERDNIAAAMDAWRRTCVTVEAHRTSRQIDVLKEKLARPAVQEVDALIAALRACLWRAWRAPGGHGHIIDIASATLARAGAAPVDVDAPSPPPLAWGDEEEEDFDPTGEAEEVTAVFQEFVPTLPCAYRQAGDSMWCLTCDLKWDTNDGHPPQCPYEEKR